MDDGLEATIRQLVGLLACLWILGAVAFSVVTAFRHPERARVCAFNLVTVQVLVGIPVVMVLDSEFAAVWDVHPLRLLHPAAETILCVVHIGASFAHLGTIGVLAAGYGTARPSSGEQAGN